MVASFAEAWIEIKKGKIDRESMRVASFAEAWIEISLLPIVSVRFSSRLLRGGVD